MVTFVMQFLNVQHSEGGEKIRNHTRKAMSFSLIHYFKIQRKTRDYPYNISLKNVKHLKPKTEFQNAILLTN